MESYYGLQQPTNPLYYFIAAIFWLGASLIAADAAGKKNLNFMAVFFISLLFSPLFALLYVIAVPYRQKAGETPAGTRPRAANEDNLPVNGDSEKVAAIKKLNLEFDKSGTMTMDEYYRRKKEIEEN